MNTQEELRNAADAIAAMRAKPFQQSTQSNRKVEIDRYLRDMREAKLFANGDYPELMTGMSLLEPCGIGMYNMASKKGAANDKNRNA